MNEISEKAIKLINDLRRDISIDIMFTPEKNAEDDSLKQLVDYIAELEGENAGLKEELQQEKTRSQLNLEAEERRMLNITYYCAEIDRLNARIAELEAAQRWIPVSERLPEIGVRVLFYNNFIKNIHKGWFSCDEWVSEIGVFYNGDKLKRITHWMPLPQPPEVTR